MNAFFSLISSADKRILVVDDIVDNFFLLQFILEEEGYQVEYADNGYTALEMIEETPPHLVLLDVMMPGIDGFEVARRVRQNLRLPFIPILLTTAYDELNEELGLKSGVDGFIRKPIDFGELLNQVKAIFFKEIGREYRNQHKYTQQVEACAGFEHNSRNFSCHALDVSAI